MKVVGLQELCRLGKGTIFSDYEPAIASGLYRLGTPLCLRHAYGEAHGQDCEYTDFFHQTLIPIPNLGDPDREYDPNDDKDMDFNELDSTSRWGEFRPDALFVVYEEADVALLARLLADKESE